MQARKMYLFSTFQQQGNSKCFIYNAKEEHKNKFKPILFKKTRERIKTAKIGTKTVKR